MDCHEVFVKVEHAGAGVLDQGLASCLRGFEFGGLSTDLGVGLQIAAAAGSKPVSHIAVDAVGDQHVAGATEGPRAEADHERVVAEHGGPSACAAEFLEACAVVREDGAFALDENTHACAFPRWVGG